MIKCSTCRRTNFESEHYNVKTHKNGKDNLCKECRKAESIKNRGRYPSKQKENRRKAKEIIAGDIKACACCGNKNFEWLEIDHIKPNNGKETINYHNITIGKESLENYQVLCITCNKAKGVLDKCPIDHSLD